MENASKALIIAGGILLTILTLSLVVFMTSATGRMADAQDTKTATEQLVAFNKTYEAYNKKLMYGTDLITVVNKAIDHNTKMQAGSASDPYYINIVIEVTSDFETTGKKVDTTKNKDDGTNLTESELKSLLGKEVETKLKIGTYGLGDWKNDETLEMKKGIINFFSSDRTDSIIPARTSANPSDYTYYIYSALTNFKREPFECKEVKYNQDTGRIQEMKFKQRN